MVVLWSTSDWARVILELPVERPAPTRTVLVPHARVIPSLQRELVRLGRADGLVGTHFVPVTEAAAAVLQAAGVPFALGEEAKREARLAALFRGELRLERLDPAELRAGRRWEEAFARTLRELEAEGVSPRDLAMRGVSPDLPAGARERDVAAIWAAIERTAGRSLTTPRLLAEAAALLRGAARRWPFEGPVLGVAAGDLSVVERDFLFAIPRLTLGLLAARPRHPGYLARMTALLGPTAGEALATAAPPPAAAEAPPTQLARLGRRLFEAQEEEGEPAQARDGSVRREVHAGADEELDAAAAWVAAEVARGTPLEELAVIVPALDPWAELIEERLARLPWPADRRSGGAPVHVPGGLPLCRSGAGALALAVVRALQERRPVERLAELLPAPPAALDAVARLGATGAPLRQIWPALRALLAAWLPAPGRDAALAAAHAELAPLCEDGVVGALPGPDALEQVARALRACRVPVGRAGGAAVFVGTPRQARGLRFDATRIVGLAEGLLPPAPLEDPVLPGARWSADRTLAALHDLDRLVRDTRRSLVLSSARRGLDREQRRPSPVLAAVAAALGRPPRRRPPHRALAARPRPDPRALAMWQAAARRAAHPRLERRALLPAAPEEQLAPLSADDPPDPPLPSALPPRARGVQSARFDPAFAATVRRAMVLLVRGAADPAAAVQAASLETGLRRLHPHAARDVIRARTALRAEGLWASRGVIVHADYPVAGVLPDGALLIGRVDLVVVTVDELFLLELRLDASSRSLVELQVELEPLKRCADLLRATPLAAGRRIRCGVLFTAEGRLWWA